MRRAAKMMMLASRPRKRRVGIEYEDTYSRADTYNDPYNRVEPYYTIDSRFRDRTGREHYEDGQFAPQSRMDYDYPQNRQERDSRGRYMRMDDNSPRDYYDPYIHGNERRMNPIGFRMPESHDDTYIGDEPKGRSEHQRGHAAGGRSYGKMDKRTAEEWAREMRNADGSTGAHWTMDKTTDEMHKRGIDCEPVEFWVTMNMLYSDYCKVFERNNAANMTLYCELAKAFLDDQDAVKGKLMAYYMCVVDR